MRSFLLRARSAGVSAPQVSGRIRSRPRAAQLRGLASLASKGGEGDNSNDGKSSSSSGDPDSGRAAAQHPPRTEKRFTRSEPGKSPQRRQEELLASVLGDFDDTLADSSVDRGERANLRSASNSPNLEITTLGTGSMSATKTRNASSLSVSFGNSTWLFDCGEGTQAQISRSSSVRTASISRIYITHLHGDHFYGLPSVLCALSESYSNFKGRETMSKPRQLEMNAKTRPPIEIFGPPNLRMALRTVLLASGVRLPFYYVVTELHPKSSRPPWTAEEELVNGVTHPCEILGKNLTSNNDFVWESVPTHAEPHRKDNAGVAVVQAALVRHSSSVPCIGYVVKEKDYVGALDGQRARQILRSRENWSHFRELGIRDPLRLLRYLKAGYELKLPTGTLRPRELIGPAKPGRKIVILGDTCDASNIAGIAANADVVVHEATNAYLPTFGLGGILDFEDEASTVMRTLKHGHSTPQMAGSFAKAIGAKALILNHLSPRYSGMVPDRVDVSREVMALYDAMCAAAQETFTGGEVFVANDLESFKISTDRKKDRTSYLVKSSYHGFRDLARQIFATSDIPSIDFTTRVQAYRPTRKEMRRVYQAGCRILPPDFLRDEAFAERPLFGRTGAGSSSTGPAGSYAGDDEEDADAAGLYEDDSEVLETGDDQRIADFDDGDLEEEDDGDDGEEEGGGRVDGDPSETVERNAAADVEHMSDSAPPPSQRKPLTPFEAQAAANAAMKPYERVVRRKRYFSKVIYPRKARWSKLASEPATSSPSEPATSGPSEPASEPASPSEPASEPAIATRPSPSSKDESTS